jgi:hypothetical protein
MHGHGMFDRPGVFYSRNAGSVFNDQSWVPSPSKIDDLKKYNLVVLDLASEHYGANGLDTAYHALENTNVNFLLLAHDPADHKKFNKMLFYPHWYHWARKNFIVSHNCANDRKYKWSCLNGVPRPHRIYNYFYSKQQSYYDDAYFTFHNAGGNSTSRTDNVGLPEYVTHWWDNTKHTLVQLNPQSKQFLLSSQCNLPANADAYIHLVTETTVLPKIFVTEKTWKPVASGQLFLIFGNPGTVGHLRDCGVDVFDDIIDHGYDSIPNWQDRLHAIHDQLRHLLSQDLKDIYMTTGNRRTDNVNKFFTGVFDTQYIQTISQCINMLN